MQPRRDKSTAGDRDDASEFPVTFASETTPRDGNVWDVPARPVERINARTLIDDDVIAYMHVHRLLHRHPEARDVNTLAPIAWDELHLGLGRGELREALKLLRLTGRLSQYRGKLRHRHTSHCAAERMRLPAEWEP